MSELTWLDLNDILDIHAEQMALFGGPYGVRDEGLLDSALARPLNRWHYGEADSAALAAFGISRNHPFIDGNKRTAFAALMVFLRANGVAFAPAAAEATAMMLALAAGVVDEDGLTRWIRDNWPAT